MEQDRENPFAKNPEKVLKDRLKNGRKLTREQFLDPSRYEKKQRESRNKKE